MSSFLSSSSPPQPRSQPSSLFPKGSSERDPAPVSGRCESSSWVCALSGTTHRALYAHSQFKKVPGSPTPKPVSEDQPVNVKFVLALLASGVAALASLGGPAYMGFVQLQQGQQQQQQQVLQQVQQQGQQQQQAVQQQQEKILEQLTASVQDGCLPGVVGILLLHWADNHPAGGTRSSDQ